MIHPAQPPQSEHRKRSGARRLKKAAFCSKFDKELVKDGLLEICAFYCGTTGRRAGRRVVFTCGSCGKPKLDALPEKNLAGCFSGSCEVPTTTDAIGLIAFFENLELPRDFGLTLKRGYEILGLDPSADPPPRPTRKKKPEHKTPPPTPEPGLLHAVYAAFLEHCPISERDLAYWSSRGVEPGTVLAGRFGSTTPNQTRRTVSRLSSIVGNEKLLMVPGFFLNDRGSLSFTLTGHYTLIPYHDRKGRITTLEGRAVTNEQRQRTAKYVALRDSGSHLYVFPAIRVDDLQAITEGVMGPIIAAQNGLAAASIKGIRCHRGRDGGPLRELVGADFSGRRIPYIPDADDPPNPDVVAEAPKAARNLVAPHNGQPALAQLPSGMDLDDWILSLRPEVRTRAFAALVNGARKPPITEPQPDDVIQP